MWPTKKALLYRMTYRTLGETHIHPIYAFDLVQAEAIASEFFTRSAHLIEPTPRTVERDTEGIRMGEYFYPPEKVGEPSVVTY